MMADRVIFVCTIVIAAVYFYATTLIPTLEIGDPLGPKAFPRLLGVCLLIAAGLFFLEMWKGRKAQQPPPAPGPRDLRHLWAIAGVTIWTGIYYAVFEKLGYVVATTIFLLALMAWFHRGKWLSNVLSTVLFSVLSFVMFVKLDVNLPRGLAPINWISDAIIVVINVVVTAIKAIFTLS
jgi:putative tricarboxylic transport membrane protein